MKSSDINLLKAKTMLPPQLVAMEGQLRTASLLLLLLLFCTGLFFGVGHLMMSRRYAAVSAQKQVVLAAVGNELSKEGLYVSLKERIGIVSRVLEGQRSWLGVLDRIDRVTGTGAKTSFTVNEKDEVSLTVTNDTLEDAFAMVERLRGEVSGKKIANPVLDSIQYQKDGTVRLAITFTPIF